VGVSDVFVNRDDQLDAMVAFRDQVVAGHGGIVLVHGDGGIGKSALFRAFLNRVSETTPHVRTVMTRCRAQIGSGDAYGPVQTALAALVPRARRAGRTSKAVATVAPELLALVPTLGPILKKVGEAALATVEKGAAVADSLTPFQQSVVRQISARFCEVVSAKHPAIVIIDDAQQIDPSSVQVLDQLLDDLAERHLGVILASRLDELSENAVVGGLIEDWRAHRLIRSVELSALTPASIEELTHAVLGTSSFALDSGRIQRLTAGNPLCVTQLLRLVRESGQAPADTRTLIDTSPDIREAVTLITRGRLARLDEVTKTLLITGATQGEVFYSTVLEEVTGLPREQVRDKLYSVCVDTHLIQHDDDGQWVRAILADSYRFEHSLLQAALQQMQSPATQRDRHSKIAQTLDRLAADHAGAPPEVTLNIARHYRSAGLGRQAAERSILVARDLVANRLSFDEAEQLVQDAINDLYEIPLTAPDRDRRLAEAIELFLILTEVHWSSTKTRSGRFNLDALARDAHEAAERTEDPVLLARAVLLRGKVTMHTRGLTESLTLLQRAVELSRAAGEPETLFIALAEYGRQLPKRDLHAGLQVLRDAESLFEQTPELRASTDPVVVHARNLTEMQLGVNLFDSGDLGAAIQRLTACTQRLRAAPLNSEIPIAFNYFSQLMIACGQWESAATTLQEAIRFEDERGGDSGWHAYNTALLALIRTRDGNRDECRQMVRNAWQETERTWLVNLVPIVRNLQAQVILDLADDDPSWLEESDRLATASVEETRQTGMIRSEVGALAIRSQIARRRGDNQAAMAFADQAVAIIDRHGDLPALRTEEVLLHAGLAHQAVGDDQVAIELISRARREVDRKLESLPADLRAAFLEDVPVNMAIRAFSL
jgi:tetratricopeptide (TPR) repeat protein